ncbi:Asp-tRNA(Asn)/Glu-tRNA(Gln) amidotransferase subunit GatC [bacterium]|nr:Asp-tRNA(Asn)/Glu-tRNA(Gln) amidotransferase subunit GatC [bacterium]
MGITLKEVDYIAELARLELNKLEREQYTNDLNQILSYVDKLNELNTNGVDPTTHVVELTNVLRKDRREPPSVQGKILNNAPEVENGCFKVKNIIE